MASAESEGARGGKGTNTRSSHQLGTCWNWDPKTPPTLGVSKGLLSTMVGGKALVELSASVGWSFPVLRYQGRAVVP